MSGHGGRRDSRKKAQREEREQDDEQEELQRRRSSGSAGGGILSFLKTELDSFVRGLSGKGDVRSFTSPASRMASVDQMRVLS